jgi:hypothetical protein
MSAHDDEVCRQGADLLQNFFSDVGAHVYCRLRGAQHRPSRPRFAAELWLLR